MKLKTPLNRKQSNMKTPKGRFSLNLPLSARRKLSSGRLSIPNRREASTRASFTTVQSRQSLPVTEGYTPPLRKEHIIENLMKKLDDEEELKSIIEAKYFQNDSVSLSAPLSLLKTSSNLNFSHVKPFKTKYDREDQRYLRQKLINCQKEIFFVKKTADQISESTKFFNQEMMRMELTKRPKLSEQFGTQTTRNEPEVNRFPGQQNKAITTPLKDTTFLSNLDSTINALSAVSVSRFR